MLSLLPGFLCYQVFEKSFNPDNRTTTKTMTTFSDFCSFQNFKLLVCNLMVPFVWREHLLSILPALCAAMICFPTIVGPGSPVSGVYCIFPPFLFVTFHFLSFIFFHFVLSYFLFLVFNSHIL